MEVDGERICRYCFEDEEEGPLISPCKCSGGQRFVHLKCLRQWQRMVLVTQPTHPQFYDRDKRHHTCNVCKSEFTCEPPTRHELMASFTGPEIAALIDEGCIIASHEIFSNELERQMRGMSSLQRRMSSYQHWIRGVFLIVSVEEAGVNSTIHADTPALLDSVRSRMDEDGFLTLWGQRWRVAARAPLINGDPGTDTMLDAAAVARLSVPCTLTLISDEAPSCGNDSVIAVNLTRPLEQPPRLGVVTLAVAGAAAKYRGAANVRITHFVGGPCDEGKLVNCIVLGGGGRGWTLEKDLQAAVELAYSRAVKRSEAQGDIRGGQTVRLTGLQSCPELNGEIGIALRFEACNERWLVRLRNGEGKQLRPQNLEGLEGATGRVFAIWGDARWSRTQLLGEIAKGDWGLCRANVGDLAAAPSERLAATAGRLAFAPITDMSESYIRDAQGEMNAARAALQMHQLHQAAEPEGE